LAVIIPAAQDEEKRVHATVNYAAGIWIALLLAIAPVHSQTAQEWNDHAAKDGSFAFSMPGQPQEATTTGTNYGGPSETLYYTTKTAKITFLFAGRTRYHAGAKFSPRSELESNRDNFLRARKGKLIAERFFNFIRGPGDVLEAIDVTIEADGVQFRQIYVVDGLTAFGLIIGTRKDANADADVGFFVNSLKIGGAKG
jgi:hypothetical protein